MTGWIRGSYVFLKGEINKGHIRSVKAKKNILASLIIKVLSIAINLILVPLTISYVNPTEYGIWLTLSSIITWIGFFDIGFGNGLRNKLAEAIAQGEHQLAKTLISTTYAILGIIISIVLLIFLVINPFINWAKILNTPYSMIGELRELSLIVFVFFCFQFVLQLLSTILIAVQQPAKATFLNFLGSLFSLIVIFILTKTTNGTLIYLGIALGFAPVIIFAAFTGWYYTHEFKNYAPAIKYVKFSYAKNLMGLGVKFFIIQIAAVVLFQTSNILIAQLFAPDQVTAYNIAFRYFALLPIMYGILLAPLWSAFTEANIKNDRNWNLKTMKKLNLISFLFAGVGVVMIIISDMVYKFWIGDSVKVSKAVSICMGLYVILNLLASPYITFINGLGKIRIQFYYAFFSIIVTIPLAILLASHFKMGPAGVIIATLCSNIPAIISMRIQYEKIMSNTARGIWNK